MDDELDWGEAVDYILTERPKLDESDVWTVLKELGRPPARDAEGLARQLLESTQPGLRWRTARLIIREWRAYASLAREDDWED
ncbi:MAG: hypothetical protein H6531_01010 [Actinobacteria bacterium]|nr:hypothetical protein [Thermoleophilia bacterium]MCB9010392.1 hypothetical protein [Actinomycetota bacterium]